MFEIFFEGELMEGDEDMLITKIKLDNRVLVNNNFKLSELEPSAAFAWDSMEKYKPDQWGISEEIMSKLKNDFNFDALEAIDAFSYIASFLSAQKERMKIDKERGAISR